MNWNLSCPHCGAVHECHSDPLNKDAVPKDGDISVCIDCGEFSIFDLRERCLRLPTDEEMHDLDTNIDVALFRAAWREATRHRSH